MTRDEHAASHEVNKLGDRLQPPNNLVRLILSNLRIFSVSFY